MSARFGSGMLPLDHNTCIESDSEVAHDALLGHLQLGMLGLHNGFFLMSKCGVLCNPDTNPYIQRT